MHEYRRLFETGSTSSTQVLPVEESAVAVDRSGNKIVAGKQSDVDDADIVKNWGKQSSVNFYKLQALPKHQLGQVGTFSAVHA